MVTKTAVKKRKSFFSKKLIKVLIVPAVLLSFMIATSVTAYASSISIGIDSGEAAGTTSALDLLFLLVFLALIPSLLLVMTAFTRIIIALSFLRSAIGIQSPPNQVLIGLALFMTIFIMYPVLAQVNEDAYKPYKEGALTTQEFLDEAVVPFKEFMLKQTYEDDLDLFMSFADANGVIDASQYTSQESLVDASLLVIAPAFITSELKRAFMIGFLLYIPFLIIDIVVSSTLMSMGMVMLPPTTIAMPFKLMLFVVVGGWDLLIEALLSGFR